MVSATNRIGESGANVRSRRQSVLYAICVHWPAVVLVQCSAVNVCSNIPFVMSTFGRARGVASNFISYTRQPSILRMALNGERSLLITNGTMSCQGNGVSKRGKVLSLETMNPHIRVMEYAVRGPIVQRATQIQKELEKVWCDHCDGWPLHLRHIGRGNNWARDFFPRARRVARSR